jgi:excisionase family DNA binding protein
MTRRLTVSIEEAAKLLGISRTFAYTLVRREELPTIHLGRRRVVPIAALTRLMSSSDQLDDSTIDLRDMDSEEAPILKAANQ